MLFLNEIGGLPGKDPAIVNIMTAVIIPAWVPSGRLCVLMCPLSGPISKSQEARVQKRTGGLYTVSAGNTRDIPCSPNPLNEGGSGKTVGGGEVVPRRTAPPPAPANPCSGFQPRALELFANPLVKLVKTGARRDSPDEISQRRLGFSMLPKEAQCNLGAERRSVTVTFLDPEIPWRIPGCDRSPG